MKTLAKKITVVSAILLPAVASASLNIANQDFRGLIQGIIVDLIKPATMLILSLAVVFFLWNIAQVILHSDKPEELATFKTKAIWGVVAIFVMVSLWALVRILTNTFVPGSSGLPLF